MGVQAIGFDPEYDPSSVKSQSVAALINIFATPERGKGQYTFRGIWGTISYGNFAGQAIRGQLYVPANFDVGRLSPAHYIVAGTSLYRVASDGSGTALGTIPGADRVEMDNNRFQVAVLAETLMFVWDTLTSTFSEVTDPDFPGGGSLGTVDGFGIVTFPKGDGFAVTAIDDYTVLSSLDRAVAESKADPLTAVRIVQSEPWFMGLDGFEVWNDTGAPDFPFERRSVNGDLGCLSRDAARVVDNSLIWLGKDISGARHIYQSVGYEGQAISNEAVDRLLQDCPDIGNANAYVETQDGHTFYVLNLSNGTVAHDLRTKLWHQRSTGVTPLGAAFPAERFQNQAYVNGVNILGTLDGELVARSATANTDVGDPIVREIRTPPFGATGRQSRVLRIQLDMDVGLGTLDSEGEVMLAVSTDGGRNFVGWQPQGMGLQGDYDVRINWGPQGMAYQWALTFRSVSDVPWRMTGAWLDIVATGAP